MTENTQSRALVPVGDQVSSSESNSEEEDKGQNVVIAENGVAPVIIEPEHIRERVVDYLGAVLAKCWSDPTLRDQLEESPHQTLLDQGIVLPDELDVALERRNKDRPRLVIYEWNEERSFKRRVCYLQLIMLAGR